MHSPHDHFNTGVTFIIMGFITVFVGMAMLLSGGNGNFGGLIMIGPIPIIFGSSPEITLTMLLAGVIIAVIYFAARRRL